MGKGFNNYMTKKFFHPSSKDNIKRVWMAQQKTEYEKKKQEDMLAQYQKEQDVYRNRALLGDQKAKVGLNFMYDPPPGLKTKEKEDDEPEYKFEWQRKYNAPREAYAKDDETIRDQPFGIEVRNVRCIKCRQWGHVNTDKICPLFGKNLTAEPLQASSSTQEEDDDKEENVKQTAQSLAEGMREDGFKLKKILLGNIAETAAASEGLLDGADEDDPEVQFLKSLTPRQKKKLLKKLNKLKKKQKKEKKKKNKHRKRKEDSPERRKKKKKRMSSSEESSSDSDDSRAERIKSRTQEVKKAKKRQHSPTSSSSSSEEETSPRKPKYSRDNGGGTQKIKNRARLQYQDELLSDRSGSQRDRDSLHAREHSRHERDSFSKQKRESRDSKTGYKRSRNNDYSSDDDRRDSSKKHSDRGRRDKYDRRVDSDRSEQRSERNGDYRSDKRGKDQRRDRHH